MKIKNKLDRYLIDKNYKITYFKDYINIDNYIEIIDFSSSSVKIRHNSSITEIIGNNLVVNKMVDCELLITGEVYEIKLK